MIAVCYMFSYSKPTGISHNSTECTLVSVVCVHALSFLISKTNIAGVVKRYLVVSRGKIQQNGTDARCQINLGDSIESDGMVFWVKSSPFFLFYSKFGWRGFVVS